MDYTTFLFPRPSFMEGMARLVDAPGLLNRYNRSETGEQADALALQMDFFAVAEDFNFVVEEYRREQKKIAPPSH